MTASTDDKDLIKALRERGHRVTSQRLVIHRMLREKNRHVSADEVMGAVEERLPNVSLPTVYSTLELLEGLGLVRRVGAVGGRVLYDSRLDEHHHAVCARCGKVEDIDAPLDFDAVIAEARRAGFDDGRAGLMVTGVCRDCGRRRR
jgi:Fe2+ or Zn2+ uptake regulation protein